MSFRHDSKIEYVQHELDKVKKEIAKWNDFSVSPYNMEKLINHIVDLKIIGYKNNNLAFISGRLIMELHTIIMSVISRVDFFSLVDLKCTLINKLEDLKEDTTMDSTNLSALCRQKVYSSYLNKINLAFKAELVRNEDIYRASLENLSLEILKKLGFKDSHVIKDMSIEEITAILYENIDDYNETINNSINNDFPYEDFVARMKFAVSYHDALKNRDIQRIRN